MRNIVVCQCGALEFEEEMTWLSGKAHCRSCYKDRYHEVYGKPYRWDDKDYSEQDVVILSNERRIRSEGHMR